MHNIYKVLQDQKIVHLLIYNFCDQQNIHQAEKSAWSGCDLGNINVMENTLLPSVYVRHAHVSYLTTAGHLVNQLYPSNAIRTNRLSQLLGTKVICSLMMIWRWKLGIPDGDMNKNEK